MKYRKLRIAWSVVWGIVAVLLVLLWVRSYWKWDMLEVPVSNGGLAIFNSCQGTVLVTLFHSTNSALRFRSEWTSLAVIGKPDGFLGFAAKRFGTRYSIAVPHWFLISAVAMLTTATWIRQLCFRFT